MNAIADMSEVEDRPRQLLIETQQEPGERVRLSALDAGVGVDEALLERLFDAFCTTKKDGMGWAYR